MKNKIIVLVITLITTVGLYGCSDKVQTGLNSGDSDEEASEKEVIEPWEYNGEKTTVPKKKSETVTVSADSRGVPIKTTCSVTLSNVDGEEVILDETNLTNIKNRSGAEEFFQKEHSLYWQNQGENIEYEGVSSESIPVDIKVTYYFNDEEIEPKDLEGKSGNIKIRIDYTNNTFRNVERDGKEYNLPIPFMAITAVFFPENVMSNIKVENGRVTSISGQDVIIGTALPGLHQALNLGEMSWADEVDIPDHIEIVGECDNFSLDFTTTFIQNGVFKDIKESDDIDELIDSMDDLTEATDALVSGAETLESGQSTLSDGIGKYLEAVNSLSEGMDSLTQAASKLSEGKQDLIDGANNLSQGMSQVSESFSQISNIIPEDMDEESKAQLVAALDAIGLQLGELSKGSAELAAGFNEYGTGVDGIYDGASQIQTGFDGLVKQSSSIKEGLQGMLTGITSLKDGLIEYRDEGISEISDFITEDVSELNDRINLLKELDNGYKNYSGSLDGMETETVYIVETEEI